MDLSGFLQGIRPPAAGIVLMLPSMSYIFDCAQG
jgi:hypothetical protein